MSRDGAKADSRRERATRGTTKRDKHSLLVGQSNRTRQTSLHHRKMPLRCPLTHSSGQLVGQPIVGQDIRRARQLTTASRGGESRSWSQLARSDARVERTQFLKGARAHRVRDHDAIERRNGIAHM
jgi:hypothetical protein